MLIISYKTTPSEKLLIGIPSFLFVSLQAIKRVVVYAEIFPTETERERERERERGRDRVKVI